MIICDTLQQAQAVTGVLKIVASGVKWNAYVAGDSIPADTTASAAEILAARRAEAKSLIDASQANDVRVRALLLVVLDTFNRQSRQFRDLLAAIAGATSLANLQTRAAAITPVEPARVIGDLKTAMQAKIDAGDAD